MRYAHANRGWRIAIAGAILCTLVLVLAWPGSAPAKPGGSGAPPPKPYTGPPIDTSNAGRCDFLDPAVCLQPWPNDYFTVADPSTDTAAAST